MEEISLSDIDTLAHRVLGKLKERDHSQAALLLLSGDLGAGKTTFVQTLAQELGVADRVVSPTFLIQKEYKTEDGVFHRLVHIDAYRLDSLKELEVLGWSETLKDPHTLIALEWPERVGGLDSFPGAAHLSLEHAGETTRSATFYIS